MEKYFGEWIPYSGTGAIILGVILFAITAFLIFRGFKLKHILHARVPGKNLGGLMILIWLFTVLTFLVNFQIYSLQMMQKNLVGRLPGNPITIFTICFAAISFLTVFLIAKKKGKKIAFWSGVLSAMAGLMIFEFPFDLIIISRTYPVIPPNPRLFRELFFFPLFLGALSTFSLLFLSPLTKITKYTLFSLASLFFVFAIWGFFGFSFAYTPLFFVFNLISKALAFVTSTFLFLPI